MESLLNNIVAQAGALGLFALMAVYLVKRNQDESSKRDDKHAEERTEWREQSNMQHKETLQVSRDSNSNQRALIALTTEIKTILKTTGSKKN